MENWPVGDREENFYKRDLLGTIGEISTGKFFFQSLSDSIQILGLIPNNIFILLHNCVRTMKITKNVWFLLKNHQKPLKIIKYESNVSSIWAPF